MLVVQIPDRHSNWLQLYEWQFYRHLTVNCWALFLAVSGFNLDPENKFCDSSHNFLQVLRISLVTCSKTKTSIFCVRNHFLVRQFINLEVKSVVCYPRTILTLSLLMLSTSRHSAIVLALSGILTYVGGSIRFRPDVQRPRQMQNALRDI